MALTTTQPQVAGLIPVSMIDWEGKVSAIIFLAGCNLRCPYCHNPELINPKTADCVPWDKIKGQLDKKKRWLDGIVITGGEPTANKDLESLIAELRSADFKIKLDTNGTKPNVIEDLVKKNVIDYFAVDVKSAFHKYDKACGIVGQSEQVKESIDLIANSKIDHEFRTTVVPGYTASEDIVEVAKYLADRGASRYVLQQFLPNEVLEKNLESVQPYPATLLTQIAEECSKFLPTKTRGCG